MARLALDRPHRLDVSMRFPFRAAALAGDEALYEGDSELRIRVSVDKAARTITLSDNGIGMSRTEVVDNIGTIARSGTRQFLNSLSGEQQKDAKLIGQSAWASIRPLSSPTQSH